MPWPLKYNPSSAVELGNLVLVGQQWHSCYSWTMEQDDLVTVDTAI